jgi:MFS family permease
MIPTNNKNLLHNRNFMLVFAGRLVSRVGDSLYTLGITWFILEVTGAGTIMSLYLAAGTASYILMSPIGGVLADRWNRVRIMYGTDYVRGLLVALAGVLFFFDVTNTILLPVLFLVTIMLHLCSAMFNPASTALTPLIVEPEQLTKANSLHAMVNSGASILGIVLGGIIYTTIGIQGIFVLNSASYLLSGFSEMFIQVESHIAVARENQSIFSGWEELLSELKEGFQYIKGEHWLYAITLAAFFINMIFNPLLVVYVPFIINRIIQAEPIYLSSVQAAIGVGMLIGSLLMTLRSHQGKIGRFLRTVLAAIMVPAICLTILLNLHIYGIWESEAILRGFVVSFFVMGVLMAMVNIPINVLIQQRVPNEILGRVDAVFNTLLMAGMPFGIVIGGVLADLLPMTLIMAGAVTLLGIVNVVLLLSRSMVDI